MPLDWSDLKLNGAPAILRALETLDKREINLNALHTHLSYQLGQLQTSHQALLDQLGQLTNLTDLSTRLADLEYLISEELLLGLAQPAEIREVVAELGAGWRIERQPQSIPAATTVEDVDRQMAGVESILGAFHRHFVLTPGYPQDGVHS